MRVPRPSLNRGYARGVSFMRLTRLSSTMMTGALCLAILGSASAGASAAAKAPVTMADVFLVEQTGGWFCPGPTVTCSARGSMGFAAELLKLGRLEPQGKPLYLRVAKARNDCAEGATCAEVGVPGVTPCPTEAATPSCALLALKQRGARLGIVLGASKDGGDVPRSPAEIAWHACQIRIADASTPGRAPLYDFMFLDMGFKLRHGALRKAVRLIQSGRTVDPKHRARTNRCPAGGWPELITNDTTWTGGKRKLDTGAWAHAKQLGAIQSKAPATPSGNALTAIDRAFVRTVNALGSRAVLRLEVTSASSEFAEVAPALQCTLLTKWARRQSTLGYTFLFPLYVHGAGPGGAGADDNPYDSLDEGTLLRQLALIADPATAGAVGCPTGAVTPAPGGNQPPPPAPRVPGVGPEEPTMITCHSARLNGWVNPHGNPTTFQFEYWKRNEPGDVRQAGGGDAGGGENRGSVSRVAEGLQRNTPYTGRLIATNAAGRAVSDIFSFKTADSNCAA